MDFNDVVFPLNLGPLTYCLPSGDSQIRPGMLVRAEVKKSLQYGIVLGKAIRPPAGPIKEIQDIVLKEPVLGAAMLRLLKWMADYYLVPEGVVLKGMALTEYFERTKTGERRRTLKESSDRPRPSVELPVCSPDILSPVQASLARHEYKTFLLLASSALWEISCALDVMKGMRNVILLVPETQQIELIGPLLKEGFGERLSIIHGGLTKNQRGKAVQAVLSGDSDIVLGTRLAVFAPLPAVSLIAVFQEQNRSYKNLEGVRYHARDVAVMRGYLEKSTVLLSSVAPSIESYYNTVKGKYTFLTAGEEARRPKVEVVNMKTSATVAPYLSKRSIQAASACVREGESALFFINRKGYSLIQCADCGDIRTCPECAIPLTYHKKGMVLRCHYCGHAERAADTCMKCGGAKLEPVGAGTQRIAADLKKHLKVEPLRLDSDALREDSSLKELRDLSRGEGIVVGTRALSGRLRQAAASKLCVFVNPDLGLHRPDFRSAELLFQEILGASEYVKPGGLILIQTKMPASDVFRCVRRYGFSDFSREELSKRRSLAYPPFSRIVVITVSSKSEVMRTVTESLPPAGEKLEVIGPLALSKKGIHICKVLLKSTSKEKVSRYAGDVLENLRGRKGLRIVVDVDPISL